jgi:hypothetical protein
VGVEPRSGRDGHGREQDLPLGLEPGQRLRVIGGLPGSGAGAGRGKDHRLLGWLQQEGGAGGGVQVVVEHSSDGGIALGLVGCLVGLLGGVGAQQVMEGVPARNVLGDQVRAGQLAQQAADIGPGSSGEAG